VTKTLLLLAAFYGLGDDSFQVREASERYLAAWGYAVVPLNRLAPRLTTDLETKARLKKLHKRYYATWDEELARNNWGEYPSLALLSPWCVLSHSRGRFLGWRILPEEPLYFFFQRYHDRAAVSRYSNRASVWWGNWRCNAATLELCRELRSRETPAWVKDVLLAYLHWRATSQERRHGVKDVHYVRR
jgi:hypothetical protein